MSDASPSPTPKVAPARILRLDERMEDDLSDSTTVEERLLMVEALSKRMWELTGRPVPTYPRAKIPTKVVRLG